MATLDLPKGKTAILIMDCQNDIVHENGKMAAISNGAMPRLIKERNVLGTIAKLAAAGACGWRTNHSCATRLSA